MDLAKNFAILLLAAAAGGAGAFGAVCVSTPVARAAGDAPPQTDGPPSRMPSSWNGGYYYINGSYYYSNNTGSAASPAGGDVNSGWYRGAANPSSGFAGNYSPSQGNYSAPYSYYPYSYPFPFRAGSAAYSPYGYPQCSQYGPAYWQYCSPRVNASYWPPPYAPRPQLPFSIYNPNATYRPNPSDLQMRNCVACYNPQGGGVPGQDIAAVANALASPQDDLDTRPISRAAWGARRVMGTLFQNCAALRMNNLVPGRWRQKGLVPSDDPNEPGALIDTRRIQNMRELERHSPFEFFQPDVVARSSFYISQTGPTGPNCRDMRKTPPIFYVAYRPPITRAKGGPEQIDVMHEVRRPPGAQTGLIAIECSGFIVTSFAAAGLRMAPNSSSYAQGAETIANFGGPGRPKDCFQPVSFAPDSTIQSGDVFAMAVPGQSYGHSLMVESVGRDAEGNPDPFRINHIRRPEDCNINNVRWQDFDFTVIQSGAILDRIAVSRMQVNEMLREWVNDRGVFVHLALEACKAKTTGRATAARDLYEDGRVSGAFLRHQSQRPECVDPAGPGRLGAAEKCLDGCADAERGAPGGDE